MISSQHAYVWVWLPGQTSPVVAGLVEHDDQDRYRFAYGRRYLARNDAISLFPRELPLRPGSQEQADGTLPSVEMIHSLGKDVLLVERFDRMRTADGWCRRIVLSALTLLGLEEMTARYASYEDLAHLIRAEFDQPGESLRELFMRIVFNVLCGNTDDHARNHAAFWDGETYRLTPAYDICPQSRTGGEATQAMLLHGQERRSQLIHCLAAAERLGLSHAQAREIIEHQLATIREQWDSVCDEADLSSVDRAFLWGRQFLNPFALESYTESQSS